MRNRTHTLYKNDDDDDDYGDEQVYIELLKKIFFHRRRRRGFLQQFHKVPRLHDFFSQITLKIESRYGLVR
jgi:hypothetical protein